MTQYKVAFCRFPGDQWEYHALATWLMQTTVKMSRDWQVSEVVPIVTCDTPITMSRNLAVKRAMAEGCDYILMVDSDMVPDYLVGHDPFARPFWETAWSFMMARREDEDLPPATIAAPYCGPPPHEVPMVFRWKDGESDCPDPNFRLEMIEREEAARRSGIEEVPALATGLILYDARTFKNLPPPWFDYEWADEERTVKALTEDVFQTRNAHLMGMPQHVLWDSWAIHVKPKLVGKPRPLTADQVHESLSAAVLRGHRSDARVRMVSRYDRPRRSNGEAPAAIKPYEAAPPGYVVTTPPGIPPGVIISSPISSRTA